MPPWPQGRSPGLLRQKGRHLGATLGVSGQPDAAIPMVEKAMRLSPRDPLTNEFLFTIASAHFQAGRYEEAIDFAERSLALKPDQPGALRVIAAAQALLGRDDEARRSVRHLNHLAPDLNADQLQFSYKQWLVLV